MAIGEPIDRWRLVWARALLGEDGDVVLWNALLDSGAIRAPSFVLEAAPLAGLLVRLSDAGHEVERASQLVWTLPDALEMDTPTSSYAQVVVSMCSAARQSLLVVSPYLEAKGIGRLLDALLGALARGVSVTLLTHEAQSLGSSASLALEELRRQAGGLFGELTVFSARSEAHVLLHSKIIVCDHARVLLGSANLTEPGLDRNLETGVVLDAAAAEEVSSVLQALIDSDLVERVFSTVK